MADTAIPDVLNILVVDDSATYRMILTRALKEQPGTQLAGTAGDGAVALGLIKLNKPDLVLLDVSMPVLDGIETLKRIRAQWNDSIDVIMCSGVDASQTGLTFQALSMGALDFVQKPSGGSPAENFASLRESLEPLIQLAKQRKMSRMGRGVRPSSLPVQASSAPPAPPRPAFRSSLTGNPPPPSPVSPLASPSPAPAPPKVLSNSSGPNGRKPPGRIEALLIGVSTGGPNALHQLIPQIPANFPVPVLCVQHMPPIFTASLADRLNRDSPLKVLEATDGMRPERGTMYIAPGGFHMILARSPEGGVKLKITDTAPVNSCRPAVDVLFQSVQEIYGGAVVTLILTGMGADGAAGVKALRNLGAWSVAQDEPSSVVWGMPGAVVQQGQADEVLPLDKIGQRIVEILGRSGGRP